MFCNICGAQNADDAKFCINCGNPLPIKRVIPVEPVNAEASTDTQADTSEPQQTQTNAAPETDEAAVGSDTETTQEANTEDGGETNAQPSGEGNGYTQSSAQQNYYNAGAYYNNQQTPPYNNGFYTPPIPEDPYKNKATASMICGIIALVVCLVSCCVLSPFSLILGIAAIILSAKSINKTLTKKSSATAGLICGIAAVVFSAAAVLLGIAVIAAYRENPQQFQQYGQEFNNKFGTTFDTFIRFLF